MQGSETIAKLASRRVSGEEKDEEKEEKEDNINVDHSKQFANHVLNKLSGHGIRHDTPGESEQVMHILNGAGLENIKRAYISGKVEPKISRKRRDPVKNFDNIGPIDLRVPRVHKYVGGSFLTKNHTATQRYEVI